MNARSPRARPLILPALVMSGLAVSCGVQGQQDRASEQVQSFTLTGDRVSIYNLAGAAVIEGHSGADVVVEMRRMGSDGGELSVDIDEIEGRESLRVRYPDDRIRYAAAEGNGRTTVRVREDGTFGDGEWSWRSLFGDRGRVEISTSASGLEAWADLRILVPADRDVQLHLAFGQTRADGVRGALSIDSGRGSVRTAGTRGRLTVDTGSGSIDVRDAEGDAELDTGSGSVRVDGVRGGQVRIDTGSGSVAVSGVETDRLRVDTGSGAVRGDGIGAESVRIDTGSGGVRLESVSVRDLRVDTGSGSVVLDVTRDVDRVDVDTGSGSVSLRVPNDVGARLEVETGSGGIETDLPAEVRTSRRGHLDAVLGDGQGSIRIDTGSGRVRIGGF